LGLNLEQKQAVVAEVAKVVAGAQAIIMVENRGMPVADMTQLRAKARASGVYLGTEEDRWDDLAGDVRAAADALLEEIRAAAGS